MADLELCFTPATELARRIREQELSPVEVVRNSLARIEEVNPRLNCFCFVFPEEALDLARAAEQAVADGEELGPLHGVPIAFKDLTPTRGKRTTMGSYAFEHWIPDRSAHIVDQLVRAGAIVVGKTTTPEFAYSSFTDSPLWGSRGIRGTSSGRRVAPRVAPEPRSRRAACRSRRARTWAARSASRRPGAASWG